MGGGGFLLLKAGDSPPESSKQAEIRLAILLKILQIRLFRRRNAIARRRGHAMVVFMAISAVYG
jgi:hypothetical protein